MLPETSFYEGVSIRQGLWLGAEVVLCQPAIPPLGEAKPLYDIVQGIAGKMGWGQHFPYKKWEDWGELVMKDIPMGVEELKKKGFWARAILEIASPRIGDAIGQGANPFPGLCRRGFLPISDLHRAQRHP